MRAVDTNVLVRILTRDDPKQAEAAEIFISNGAWVSHLVLAETVWVLQKIYGLSAKSIACAVDMILTHKDLTLQDADVVNAALRAFQRKPALRFSDCLIVQIALSAGHTPLGTFDRGLSKLTETVWLASGSD